MYRSRNSQLGSINEVEESKIRNSAVRQRGRSRIASPSVSPVVLSPPPPGGRTSVGRTPSHEVDKSERSATGTTAANGVTTGETGVKFGRLVSIEDTRDDSRQRSSMPVVAVKLPRRNYLGKTENEDHYLVELDQPTVCRRRAASVTDPRLMTDDERRLLKFLQTEADTGRPRGHSRIYTDQSWVIDPKLSPADFRGDERLAQERRGSRLVFPSVITLPPIHKQATAPLQRRKLNSPSPEVPKTISDAAWRELKYCKYLRPKALRFRQAYAEDRRRASDADSTSAETTNDVSDDVFYS